MATTGIELGRLEEDEGSCFQENDVVARIFFLFQECFHHIASKNRMKWPSINCLKDIPTKDLLTHMLHKDAAR